MASLPSPDSSLFTISPDQKVIYETHFKSLCKSGDLITGDQAKGFMLKSGLPPMTLGQIWTLSDVDCDGKMDINEFSIALHLIALRLKGVELPTTLPSTLKILVEPPPPFASFDNNTPTKQPAAVTNSISPSLSLNKMEPLGNAPLPGKVSKPGTPVASTEWAIPQQSKLKYTQLFNSHDRSRTGFLSGYQARNILLESKLPQNVLAKIWNLSDIDADGRLTNEEFVLAMHLIDKAKNKEPLPVKLPPDFIPPSYRRSSVNSLSHSSSVEDTSEHADVSKSSFEDKRRENFEKGQAELDRRRAALMEQQKRERDERERKEREENARREKERLEAERRKQEEIERNMQKLREQELEKKEANRRAMEVRELARKEMERQRQRELEQARRNELLIKRARLLEEVQKLKSRRKALTIDHEKIDKLLLNTKDNVTASRLKVVKVKNEIDGMRIKRDEKLAKQASFKAQFQEITDKQLFIEQEKVKLSSMLKSLISKSGNNVTMEPQFSSFNSILQSKQLEINQLKAQLERVEQEIRTKKHDSIKSKRDLAELKKRFESKRLEARNFSKLIEAKRIEAEKVRDGTSYQQIPRQMSDAKADVFNDSSVVWDQEVPTNFEWPSANKTTNEVQPSTTTQTKFKYRCVFAFQARNSDELTIEPDDIIMVDTSACSEPDWLSGEVNGKIGWFPKDYAVIIDEPINPVQKIESSFDSKPSESKEEKPGVRQGKALYDYSATETGHISFFKDDLLRITDQQDSWMLGELLDSSGNVTASGWCPENYIQIISDSQITSNGVSDINKAVPVSAASTDDDQKYYVSLYPFESIEPGDLGFVLNEFIRVDKKDGDWWSGVIIDRTTGKEDPNRKGIFPSNFVSPAPIEDIPSADNANNTPKVSAEPPIAKATVPTVESKPQHQALDRKESELSESPKPTKKTKSKKLEIVTAIASYTATGSEQLSLEAGQLIQVRKKMATGWWEGELQAKGKKKQVGWFPASYVKPLGGVSVSTSSARSTPDSTLKNTTSTTDEPEIDRVIALYAFRAECDTDLGFEANDTIRVLSKPDPTWWRGHNMRTGAVGLFPSNYVDVQPASPAATAKPESDKYLDNHSASGSDSSITNIHQKLTQLWAEAISNSKATNGGDMDDNTKGISNYNVNDSSISYNNENDVSLAQYNHQDDQYDEDMYTDSFDDDTDSDSTGASATFNRNNSSPKLYKVKIDDVANRTENKSSQTMLNQRFNLIYELITTEKDYVDDLYFTIEKHIKPLKKVCSATDVDQIFGNIDKIYLINTEFLKELNGLLEIENVYHVCELMLKYLQKMLPFYKAYCSNQVTATRILQDLIENNSKFNESLQQISIESQSHLPLSSYLLKPMQRITKYPLLIEKIFKCTPSDYPDYKDCETVFHFSKTFCNEINEACGKTENFNKLDWIQKNVMMQSKSFRQEMDFNSETQFLGPRTLIRAGLLVKASSSKILVAFLFNDFLLFATPNKKLNKVMKNPNFFHNKKALEITYTIYRKPFMLNEFDLVDLPEFESSIDPTMFRLKVRADRHFITLRANSLNECSQWMKDISSAKQCFHQVVKMRKDLISKSVPSQNIIGTFFVTVVEAIQLYTQNIALNANCKIGIGKDWNHLNSLSETKTICYKWKNKERKLKNNFIEQNASIVPENIKGPFKVVWDQTFKFHMTDLYDNLIIRCFDNNPFIPSQCLGERNIPVQDLIEHSESVNGPITQDISLHIPYQQLNKKFPVHQMNPSLLIKFDFVHFNTQRKKKPF